MKNRHLDKILGKLEDLDPGNLTILIQRLARERELLETVFNTIKDGILLINEDGVIEYSNEAANHLINLKPEDVGKAVLWKLVPDLDLTFDIKHFENTHSLSSREVHVSYPENKFIRIFVAPFEEDEEISKKRRFIVILTDVTEEKHLTEQMIEEEKLASVFLLAAGVAHEIRNPINSINIHLQLIERSINKLKKNNETDKIEKSVNACVSELNRLDGIVNNFLNAIRPVPPELTEVNLLQLLDEVLAFQAPELENLGVRVEVELKTDLPNVLADKTQMKQVFFNLIKNAIEAMNDGGLLKITTDLSDEFVYLKFIDTGVGLDPESLGRIFDPYYSSKADGHGLGMMIVQRIMRAHGGKIAIDSKKGKGTTVTLQLPLKVKRVRLLESHSDE